MKFGIRNSEFEIRNSKFGIRVLEFTKSGNSNSEFAIRRSEFEIRNSKSGSRNSESETRNLKIRIRWNSKFIGLLDELDGNASAVLHRFVIGILQAMRPRPVDRINSMVIFCMCGQALVATAALEHYIILQPRILQLAEWRSG